MSLLCIVIEAAAATCHRAEQRGITLKFNGGYVDWVGGDNAIIPSLHHAVFGSAFFVIEATILCRELQLLKQRGITLRNSIGGR